MAETITASDVFEMAKSMEQVGKDFYEALATGSDDVKVRQFCVQAARDEAAHLRSFETLRRQWADSVKKQPPNEETQEALREMVKNFVQPTNDVVRKVAIGGKLADALEMAMGMERDSIQFYQNLRVQLPQMAGALDAIVAEEQLHVRRLRSLGA